jgi:hypothetical protein
MSMPPVEPRSRSPSLASLESNGVKKLATDSPLAGLADASGWRRTTLLPKLLTPSNVPLPLT